MPEIEYHLEIYSPGSFDDVWQKFISSSPFIPIHSGELLNPAQFSHSKAYPTKLLRVVEVEHLIWEFQGKINQEVLVFTEEVDDSYRKSKFFI